MLVSLFIQNVILIESLNIEFKGGFCALTGETGAGKSILLDSLGLALGARSDAGLVRKGAEQASVAAEFHIPKDHAVLSVLTEQGLEADTTLILRRTVGTDGRSRAFINDQPASIGLLRQVGDMLVEIHGQFDTQGLLDPKTHGGLLDEYAGVDTGKITALWNEWSRARAALQAAIDGAQKARQEEDYLRAAVDDLDTLDPKEGEEDKLASLRDKLMRRDQILGSLNGAHDGLVQAEETLGKVWRLLERVGDDGAPLMEGLDRASIEIQEVMAQLQSQSSELEDNEYSLGEIDDRLHTLRAQARKHGCTVNDLPEVRNKLARQLSLIERQDEVLGGLKDAVAKARKQYCAQADAIHAQREKSAQALDKLVAKELPPLKLEKARFVTQVESLQESEWGPLGHDRIRFLVATNPGSAPGALDKIASGGEMSRFMLALKVVMAAVGVAQTYIFDEVDSGIGGPTAAAVGERLARLSQSRQILVVTHAPQVAARAQHHWIVSKGGVKDVRTTVIPLQAQKERQEEIARMLSGAQITDEARAAASRLLETGT